MKPLEVGCLAIMLRGDNCGKVVTCLAKIPPPGTANLRLGGVMHHGAQIDVVGTDTDGKVWAVSGNITVACISSNNSVENHLIEFYTDNLICNGMYPSNWLMRIDGLDIDDKCIVGNSLKTTIERLV